VIAEPLAFRGAILFRETVHTDIRGTFRRIIDSVQLAELGLESKISQISNASNARRGTIRGMHYQVEPYDETKIIWCNAGAVFDVLVDLRPDEATFGQWTSVGLRCDEPTALYVPRGMAHGYQTLDDDSSLTYFISTPYEPAASRALLWSDPTIGIAWPLAVASISPRDAGAPQWPPQH
jgi:dTDP-4-dehydrorhamnose 3,5-epimerase